MTGTGANVHDVTQAGALLNGQESAVFGDSGYTGVDEREEIKGRAVDWYIAAKPSAVRRLDGLGHYTAKALAGIGDLWRQAERQNWLQIFC